MNTALVLLLCCPHTTSIARERIAVEGAVAAVEMRVQTATCLATLELDRDGDGRLSAAEVVAGRPEIERYVLGHFLLYDGDGASLAGRLESVRPAEGLLLERGGEPEPLLDLALRFEAPSELARLAVESRLFRASELAHRDHVEIAWPGRAPAARVLSQDDPRWEFDPSGGAAGVLAGYVRLGFEHILGGWDHLAFLVALVAASRRWQTLLGVVTAFTAAHSLSLALAATGVVVLPARLVEPAIAISIAWVAIKNLLARAPRRTWPEAFGFGLIHGLGFAGFLGELLAGEEQKLAALFGFNVGVEIGQAAIVIALHLFLRGLARDAGEPAQETAGPERTGTPSRAPRELDRPRLAMSAAVALLGIYWSVSRLCSG